MLSGVNFVAAADPVSFNAADTQAAVVLTGQAKLETLAFEIGSLRQQRLAITVAGTGSTASVTLGVSQNSQEAYLLEIEEIHNRRPQVFGYQIEVNGTMVYFRSYEEMAAGSNRFFVQVPRSVVPDGRLMVTFRSESDAPFSISRVWAHADFFALADSEGTYQTMDMYGEATVLTPALAPVGETVSYEAINKAIGTEAETKAWSDMRERLAGTGYATGPFINLQYALMPFHTVRSSIDQGLERVLKHGVDFQLAFNSGEWGSHPDGPDGLGGFFSDAKYSSISFDKEAQTYRPTWLNTPGNTTWPAWNDPQLQLYLKHKLTASVQYYMDQRDFLTAHGATVPFPVINQDWGLAASPDCSDSNIIAAKKDGVSFTPEDGLSDQEKMWLYRSMSRVPSRFGAIFAEAVGREPILVDRGTVIPPKRQSLDDYYFQTFADASNSPFHDDQWAGWQYAVGPQTWVTGEFLPHLPAAYFDYIMAHGKLACPNLERMALPTLEYVQTCYERGFRSLWLCNARSGDIDLFAPQAKGQDDKPCTPETTVNAKVLDLLFSKQKNAGPIEQIVLSDNIGVKPDVVNPANGGKMDELQVVDGTLPGRIIYRLTSAGGPFAHGLELDLTARFTEAEGSSIDIAVGVDQALLTTVATLKRADFFKTSHYPWKASAHLKLGETMRNQSACLLQITVQAAGKSDNVGIEHLRVSQPWSTTGGHPGGAPFTIKQKRTLHLWTQDRAVLERMETTYRQHVGEDATYRTSAELAAQGRLLSAYRTLAGELSQLLPARFAVRGQGPLGRYPVSVKLSDEDQVLLVDLTKAGPSGFAFSVKTEKPQRFQVRVAGLRTGEAYKLSSTGVNSWSLTPPSDQAVGSGFDGSQDVELEAQPIDPRTKSLPRNLSGSYAGPTEGGILIETQADGLWLDNPIFVPVAKDAVFTRVQSGSTGSPVSDKPKSRDQVDLVIDAAGVAQEVRSTFGAVTGRIKAFHPPVMKGELSNGVIELDDGGRYEFANQWGFTTLKVPGLKWRTRSHRAEELAKALVPGLEVQLTFCPYVVNQRLPRMISLTHERKVDPNLGPSIVYDETMQSGWFQNGWDSTIDIASTAMVNTGKTSMAITITEARGAGGFFHLNGPFDTTPYRSLTFWINGGPKGGQKLKVILYEGAQFHQLPTLDANTWVKHTVKLADIGAENLTDLSALRFVDQGGTSIGATFHVDDVSFGP